MSLKLKINTKNWLLYIILIPFLYPRGFSEYITAYKTFFTLWLYGAMVCIFFVIISETSNYKVSLKPYNCWLIIYFMAMVFVTLLVLKTFNAGLQKMFATPALCLLCAIYLKKSPKILIQCLNNILTMIFLLNLTIFNPLLWKQYFAPITNHITFLGHVHVNAQLGIVAIFFAYLNYYLYSEKTEKLFLRIILSIITMITSFTSASYIALIFLLAVWVYKKLRLTKLVNYKTKIHTSIYFFLNILLFYFVTCKSVSLSVAGFSLNGRGHIWRKALDSFYKSPIYGYGVHGVLIKVFWSAWVGDGTGLNYMHNQILQVLNDGGVILFIPYMFMIFSVVKQLNKLEKGNLRFWSIVCIAIMLFIMTFESVMEYFYVFIMFATVAYLPGIYCNSKRVKWRD